MQLSRPEFGTRVPIDAYGDGGFRFGGVFHKGSQLILPEGNIPWPHSELAHTLPADIEVMKPIAGQIDFLLIGGGLDIAKLPKEAQRSLDEIEVTVELMNTGAACRTFNVLIAEKRSLAALLIAVD